MRGTPHEGWAATIEPPSLTGVYLAPLLDALVAIDSIWIEEERKAGRQVPSLYAMATGVKHRFHYNIHYEREPRGFELWASIPVVLRMGYGDCEDLACWRVAELRALGEKADPMYKEMRHEGGTLMHILVRRESGAIEDPSLKLGMNSPFDRAKAKPPELGNLSPSFRRPAASRR